MVLVEGDGDAQFYAAALDAAAEQGGLPISPSDVLFIPCSGKGGMARLSRALAGLGVPVVANPDLDILQNAGELRTIVEALGGTWATISADHGESVAAIAKGGAPLLVDDLLDALAHDHGKPLDREISDRIDRFLRTPGGGWAAVKSSGINAFGGGNAGVAVRRVLEKLSAIGLVPVNEGELESFDHDLGAGKSRWAMVALEARIHAGWPQSHTSGGSLRRGSLVELSAVRALTPGRRLPAGGRAVRTYSRRLSQHLDPALRRETILPAN